MGYDKLLEKVKCKVIESCDDGGQLLEVDTQTADNLHGVDKIMRMVKVYVYRLDKPTCFVCHQP